MVDPDFLGADVGIRDQKTLSRPNHKEPPTGNSSVKVEVDLW